MNVIRRYVHIRFMAADPERILTQLSEADIAMSEILWIDDLTVEMSIRNGQYLTTCRLLQKAGIKVINMKRQGVLWIAVGVLRRPVLVAGLLLLMMSALLLSQRVLFVEVAGNESISEHLVPESAGNCGIAFGARVSHVRSEEVKNYLLSQHPQLQWVGITTSGCVATIRIKERSIVPEETAEKRGVSSIVAALDGLITEQTVSRGTPLFQPGQSVKAGDVLISGYTDSGLKMTAQQAEGEVFAHTLRQLHLISPVPTAVRREQTQSHTCYRLRMGKKVINLCNHSGIQDATCVKMYSEDYWTLPGGYRLPVSVIKVECAFYETIKASTDRMYDWMSEYAENYLRLQMTAGQVLDELLYWNVSDRSCDLRGEYACHEMIGRVKHEEILEQYAENS